MKPQASAMCGRNDERVALCDVSVDATLRDLLAHVTVTQTWRNDEAVNIEAVYTFPLPLDAVLLDFTVAIGKRRLTGTVAEKKAAEAAYEEAIDAGDAAVMLEAIEPGLYTMNVGNLLPNETATVTFSYAMLYRWSGDRLRFHLPTTIAPRYGEWRHAPHQVPEASLNVENQFSLRVEVHGALQDAQFDCPSHAVTLARSGASAVLSLEQVKAAMDRDFVLDVRAPQASRSFALTGRDGEGVAALASFQPFFPGLRRSHPLNLAVVIDCSGSMAGDSIAQAKQALDGILERLQADDRATIIAFGSSINALSERPLACTGANVAKARRFARSLDANLGGTEIGAALDRARKALGSEPADVFLVTDGQATDWERVTDAMVGSGHRVFTVGVGSAVSEAFLQSLAQRTGGHCELVSPREGMADRVVRHFERMRAPRARHVRVLWPEGAANLFPATIGAVFEGDTVVASATFDGTRVDGTVTLEVETFSGEVFRQALALPALHDALEDGPFARASAGTDTTIVRVCAALRLPTLDAQAGLATALRHRLMSPWTNYLVVAERAEGEKADGMPELRKVPQTVAAGWHGLGSVLNVRASRANVDSVAMCISPAIFDIVPEGDPRPVVPSVQHADPTPVAFPAIRERLFELIDDDPHRLDAGGLRSLLHESGLASELADLFVLAFELGIDEESLAMIVVARFAECDDGDLSPDAQAAFDALGQRAEEAFKALRELRDRAKSLRAVERRNARMRILRRFRDDETSVKVENLAALVARLEGVNRGSITVPPLRVSGAAVVEVDPLVEVDRF